MNTKATENPTKTGYGYLSLRMKRSKPWRESVLYITEETTGATIIEFFNEHMAKPNDIEVSVRGEKSPF